MHGIIRIFDPPDENGELPLLVAIQVKAKARRNGFAYILSQYLESLAKVGRIGIYFGCGKCGSFEEDEDELKRVIEMDELAAMVVAHLKDPLMPDGIRLLPAWAVWSKDYIWDAEYNLTLVEHMVEGEHAYLCICMKAKDKILFSGTPAKLIEKYEE